MSKINYICQCFLEENYFIKHLDRHFYYRSRDQLLSDYSELFISKTDEERNNLFEMFEKEKERRCNLGIASKLRQRQIKEMYTFVHPYLKDISEKMFAPEFLDIVKFAEHHEDSLMSSIQSLTAERVFAFPVFASKFCEDFIEEMENFEHSDCPKERPNTMNQQGILLDEIGLDDNFLKPFRETYLRNITAKLFPDLGGESLDSHKAFIVKYSEDKDKDLSYHFDNAEVTINICLGKSFKDGDLYFGGQNFHQYKHEVGKACLHRGLHKHGALPITEGIRYNLIIWMRSSKIRNNICPMCKRKPRLLSTEGPGDGFMDESVNVCSCI